MIHILSLRATKGSAAIQNGACGSGLLRRRCLLAMTASVFLLCGCIGSQNAEKVSVVSYGVKNPAGSTGMHTVLEGDTVYTVSKHYNLPMRDIITVNKLSAPYVLNVGYRMKLPAPNEYTVKEEDTLQSVANMFDTSAYELAQINHLNSPYRLEIGQVLRLPSLGTQVSVIAPSPQPSPRGGEGVRTDVRTGEGGKMITPEQKPVYQQPKVQKASAPVRAKIPDHVPARSGNGRFMQPVDGKIISGYGPKKGGLHNDGINIKVPKGTPVRAAENGVVVYSGSEIEGYGNLILVRHRDRYMTAYAHMDKMLVKRGATVKAGQSIGTVGSTGSVDTPQLHFEIRKGSKAVNPQKYL